MTKLTLAVLAGLSLAASPLLAHDYEIGALSVMHPMAFETAASAQTGGGFMTITNNGEQDDMLVAVEADFPRVEIHTTEMDGDVARMIKIEGLALPAGETVTLQPGGFHVMFMGLGGDPFELGEEVPATLIFQNAGALDVLFTVEERKMDGHSGMDHSGH
ncbi:MAG: copper chaperone PCu(A)C [Yoonia sp.]|uniref:copper chaperone PCu(A)C n=1 Tax=Yoonia sp. TaxID=2212373 RepID=UPI003EF40985